MLRYLLLPAVVCLFAFNLFAQRPAKKASGYPDSIVPVGIVKNISDLPLNNIGQNRYRIPLS